mmetsp:Transcript_18714/g.52876  ORF Transcript_18714/g.52876 Transcript_18714/m.52876 type:complete len:210 (+) Transcript_18714:1182-1811(+)
MDLGTTPSSTSALCTSIHEEYGSMPLAVRSKCWRIASAVERVTPRTFGCCAALASICSRTAWCWQLSTYFSLGSCCSDTRMPTTGTLSGCVSARTISSLLLSVLGPAVPATRRQAVSTSPVRTCSKTTRLCTEELYRDVQPCRAASSSAGVSSRRRKRSSEVNSSAAYTRARSELSARHMTYCFLRRREIQVAPPLPAPPSCCRSLTRT